LEEQTKETTYEERLKPRTKTLLIWDIPEDLKKRFKTRCFLQGVSMREVIIRMLEQYVDD